MAWFARVSASEVFMGRSGMGLVLWAVLALSWCSPGCASGREGARDADRLQSLWDSGRASMKAGDFEEALSSYESGVALAEATTDRRAKSVYLNPMLAGVAESSVGAKARAKGLAALARLYEEDPGERSNPRVQAWQSGLEALPEAFHSLPPGPTDESRDRVSPPAAAENRLIPNTSSASERAMAGAVGLEMKWMPAGRFSMGSPGIEPGRSDHEGPQREVTITKGFWLQLHEVTQEQFQQVTGRTPSFFDKKRSSDHSGAWHRRPAENRDLRPVEQVTWYDAVAFCNALTALVNSQDPSLGLQACYRLSEIDRAHDGSIRSAKVEWLPGRNGFRLPTEAEWEYACRAGTTTAYSFGEDARIRSVPMSSRFATTDPLDEHAWFKHNSLGNTQPVATKKANAWGLFDMHGNVWEWCWDRYGEYPAGAQTDPTGPPSGSSRVLRGGSWVFDPPLCRAAVRDRYLPGRRNFNVGFRVARTP